jgi:hypothetical protein
MKRLRNFILSIAALAVFLPGCVMLDSGVGTDSGRDHRGIIGSGRTIVIVFDFRDFRRIYLSQAFKATVRKSNTYSVRVEVDDNIQQYLVAHQSADAISIGLEDNSYQNTTMNVTIETPDVSYIEASGAACIQFDAFVTDHPIEITGSGACSISGSLVTSDLKLNLTGSSTVELTGNSASLSVSGTGATQLSLFEFPVKSCKAVLTGGSVSSVRVSDYLEVNLTGGSVFRYKGDPPTKILSAIGGSVIQKVG